MNYSPILYILWFTKRYQMRTDSQNIFIVSLVLWQSMRTMRTLLTRRSPHNSLLGKWTKRGEKVLFSLLLFPQLSLPLHVRRLTWQGTTITSPGGFLDCVLSIYPDHEWAIAHKHVGWCHTMPGLVQKRQWEREEMSLLVVSTVTQELQIVGVHLQLCCSMWKSLQAPDFYGSCGKMQSQRYESSMGRQHVCCYSSKKPLFLPPPLVLLAAYSRKLPGMEQSSHALSLILPSSSVGK